jgi:GTP-binding protein
VGRPNVGKSTLFNRLAGSSIAIVHDTEGVTRDRHYADAHVRGRDITLIDTGGFDPTTEDPLRQGIARGVAAAVEEADVVVCVLDGVAGPTEADRATVETLRKTSVPVVYAANKSDGERQEHEAAALYELGVDRVIAVSALHGRGMHQLEAAIIAHLPPPAPVEPVDASVPRIALLGRPNAGKSSLFNRLCGAERSIVDARPGTTVDPVDTRITLDGHPALLIDTAGVRRKARVERGIEAVSVIRAIRTMERSDVVILLTDATTTVAEQDARLLGLAAAKGRGIVVGLNKLDLLGPEEAKAAEEQARTALHFAPWAPIVGLSAKTGRGVKKLVKSVVSAHESFNRRVSTAALNRFFRDVLSRRPPPTQGGRAPRLYYVTQAEAAPPVFVVMCSSPSHVRESYRRFVTNQLRSEFGFFGVPLIVHFRPSRGRGEG